MNVTNNFRKILDTMIAVNPSTIEKYVYKLKDDGFGGTITDHTISPDIVSEKVRFVKGGDNLDGIRTGAIGFTLPIGEYVLMKHDTVITLEDEIVDICSGNKYRVGAMESLTIGSQIWAKRAKVEKIK